MRWTFGGSMARSADCIASSIAQLKSFASSAARACALAFNQRQQRQRVPAVLTRQRRVGPTEGVREVSGL